MLSIDTAQKGDRITTITSATWAEYIALDLPKKRVSYRDGVITIVSPGRNHETIGDLVRMIILFYCRQNDLSLFPHNSTTLKAEGKEGKEPDVAYCFGVDKDKPDIAVEINLTSGSLDDLTKYQYLNIPEVWLWEKSRLDIYILSNGTYKLSANSLYLDGLTCDRITEVVDSCFGKSLLEVERYFGN